MAPFTQEQSDYIINSIEIAMNAAMVKIDGVFGEVKGEHEAIKTLIQNHHIELEQNSQRVSNLVADVNAKADALRESMAQISETEQKLASLTGELNDFAAKQAEIMDTQMKKIQAASTEVEQLSLNMTTFADTLDSCINAAVDQCKTTAFADDARRASYLVISGHSRNTPARRCHQKRRWRRGCATQTVRRQRLRRRDR